MQVLVGRERPRILQGFQQMDTNRVLSNFETDVLFKRLTNGTGDKYPSCAGERRDRSRDGKT